MRSLDLIALLLWGCAALAVLNVALQAVDLHTTSELLKHGYGREANPRLGKYLNDPGRPEDAKFWLLVAVKLACAVAAAAPAVIAWQMPNIAPAMAAAELWIAWVYGRQMRVNWALYSDMTRKTALKKVNK
jgi:hypothetical protein